MTDSYKQYIGFLRSLNQDPVKGTIAILTVVSIVIVVTIIIYNLTKKK